MQELTQKLVRSLFDYKDGNLYWKVKKSQRIKIGDKAGSLNKVTGYYQIKINYKLYRTHRLIYLYFNGYLPKFLDHIDGNPANNNIENLREATKSENMMNCKSYKNTSSKFKGVYWNKAVNKWHAQIKINNKNKYLGLFKNESDAAQSYNKAAIELFGEFACLNKI